MRGKEGTPPASEETISNLPEISILEKHCKITENGNLEYP